MRIKHKNQLIDFLSDKSQIRKRELITVLSLLNTRRDHELSCLCRSSVMLAYAHWEGFIKDASTRYVEYVAAQNVRANDLSINFQAVVYRPIVLEASQANRKINPHIKLLQQIGHNPATKSQVNPNTVIDTESSLNANVFENICLIVGIDYTMRWSRWGPFINDLFLNRCAIAHGEFMPVQRKYAEEAVNFAQNAIDWFKTDIENAVLTQSYLRI